MGNLPLSLFMRKIFLAILVIFAGCSQLQMRSTRFPANLKSEKRPIEIEVFKNRETVFANGADSLALEIVIKEDGKEIQIDPKEIKVLSNREFEQTEFKFKGGRYRGEIRPKVGSEELKLIVAYQEAYLSEEVIISTYLTPQKEKLEAEPWQPSMSSYVSGISYRNDANALPNQYLGFEFYNYGNNRIVNTSASKHSNRQYGFEFPQHASQNISLLVVDAPNEFTSHGMYSHLMFFPRTYLPHIRQNKKNEAEVTLPTGEKLSIDIKSGEILDGVLQEGPVDVSADRFKRKYANLHYTGKGILLRANARGQMPQQGQFENTKIDMQDGNSGSFDVLIINGTTGERCRRPKSDFWSSADVQTILFKFPSDKEFDAYLRAKCKFGIPEMPVESQEKVDTLLAAQEIWKECLENPGENKVGENFLLNLRKDFLQEKIRSCLNYRIGDLKEAGYEREVAYHLYFLYLHEREKEIKDIPSLLKEQERNLEQFLETDYSWIKDATLKAFESECKIQARNFEPKEMKFYDFRKDLNTQDVCRRIKEKIGKDIDESQEKLTEKFLAGEGHFKKIQKLNQFDEECRDMMLTLVNKDFTYYKHPFLYQRVFAGACDGVKKSQSYKDFMASSEDAIHEDVTASSFTLLEELGNQKALICLEEFPANNPLNRIRYKGKREACLTEAWPSLEDKASRDSFKKKGYPFNEKVHIRVIESLRPEARRLQLKIIKDKF